jgi:hypothetical protein
VARSEVFTLRLVQIYVDTKLFFAFCSTHYTPFRDQHIFECSQALTELAHTNGQDGTKLFFAFCLTHYTPFQDQCVFDCSRASTELAGTNGQDGKSVILNLVL